VPGILALVVFGATAHAQEIVLQGPLIAARDSDEISWVPRELGVGEAALEVRALRATASSPSAPTTVGETGIAGRFVHGDRWGPAGGAELEIGASDRGVAGDALVFPLGLGADLGPTGFVSIVAGAGAQGWGSGPVGLALPVDARVAFDVGSHVRLSFDARLAWLPLAPTGEGAAPHVPFCDEARFGITTRIGRLWEHRRFRDGGGYFFRLEHAEMLGTSFLGLAVGYQMSGSG
jgi:hypothetical protein